MFELWPLAPHSCQKMQMLQQKITAIHLHYRKDRLTGSMYVYLAACTVRSYLCWRPNLQPPFILIFPTELAYNDEQIHKFEKWVCVHTAALWLALPCEGFCPELSRNLLVTVTSQNPPVVPHQAREVSLQRGQRAAVQRALGHNKDVEQVRATSELSKHTAGFTRTTIYCKTFVCLNKKPLAHTTKTKQEELTRPQHVAIELNSSFILVWYKC